MINKLKRINYSIYLDVKGSEADQFAADTMMQWSMQTAELKLPMEIQNAMAIHKHVYMSGLFLQLLSPSLTKRLSSLLTKDMITGKTLGGCLNEAGIPLGTAQPDDLTADGSKGIMSTLTEVLSKVEKIGAKVDCAPTQSGSITSEESGDITAALTEVSRKVDRIGAKVDDGIPAQRVDMIATDNEDVIALIKSRDPIEEIRNLKAMIAGQSKLIDSLVDTVTILGQRDSQSLLPSTPLKDLVFGGPDGGASIVDRQEAVDRAKKKKPF